MRRLLLIGLVMASVGLERVGPASAQGGWNPFAEHTGAPPPLRRSARPAGEPQRPSVSQSDGARFGIGQSGSGSGGVFDAPGQATDGVPAGQGSRATVESMDLAPLTPAEGAPAAVPSAQDTARATELAKLSAAIEVPARSAAVSRLLVRLIGVKGWADTQAPEGIGTRAVMLYRAGRVTEANAVASEGANQPLPEGPIGGAMLALRARLALAAGDRERACADASALIQSGPGLPATLTGEGIVIQGYCGAASGNANAATLAASLAREHGGVAPATLAALEAAGAGDPPQFPTGPRIGIIEWRLAEVSGKLDGNLPPPERFEAAAIVAIAGSAQAPPKSRIAAAEAAARIHAIDPPALADAYRLLQVSPADLAQAAAGRGEAWSRRALLFKAAEAERTPFKRTRLIRAALDEARRSGLYVVMAAALARLVEEVKPVPEVGWFAETAVEIMLAAGRPHEARRWAEFGAEPGVTADRASASLSSWLALIDIADLAPRNARGASLSPVEDLALRGRFTADGLHRLATVLDALDYNVPVRLWEAASRAPQPTAGHLPPTGVLTDLQAAAKRRDLVATVGLVFRTLGADGPEGAHMIALGDAIRALKRAGLEADARAIAFEALFAVWPRASSS